MPTNCVSCSLVPQHTAFHCMECLLSVPCHYGPQIDLVDQLIEEAEHEIVSLRNVLAMPDFADIGREFLPFWLQRLQDLKGVR